MIKNKLFLWDVIKHSMTLPILSYPLSIFTYLYMIYIPPIDKHVYL